MKKRKFYSPLIICLLLCVIFCGCEKNVETDTSGSVSSAESQTSQVSSAVTSSKTESSTPVTSSKPTAASKPAQVSKPAASSVAQNTSSQEDEKVEDWRKNPEKYKLIAFTLDDAPISQGANGTVLSEMMSTFESYDGRATFFVIGTRIDSYGYNQLKAAVDRGFELGNHTYSHADVATNNMTADQYREDVTKLQDMVKNELGVTMKYLRPSGLHTNDAVYQIAKELNMPLIFGNRGGALSDWQSTATAASIAKGIRDSSYNGAIILLHSWNSNSLAALQEVLPELYEDGYRFCTLSEFFEFKGKSYASLPKDAPIYGIGAYDNEIQTEPFVG